MRQKFPSIFFFPMFQGVFFIFYFFYKHSLNVSVKPLCVNVCCLKCYTNKKLHGIKLSAEDQHNSSILKLLEQFCLE